jgi:hypothetical protein
VLSKLAGPLKVLPREVRETRQRAGQIVGRSNRSRLHHAQVGTRRDTQACKLIGRDAAIGGHDQFVTRVLTCHIHDAPSVAGDILLLVAAHVADRLLESDYRGRTSAVSRPISPGPGF